MPLQPLQAGAKRVLAVLLSLLMLVSGFAFAQGQPPPGQPPALPPPDQPLTPDQLEDLVAPVALYPDPLLSQLLVASTYPLEVVQAYQWMQRNPALKGPALTQAAQQQNWNASVQALVMFPDVLKQLNADVTWTTNLGNAFLAQQQDVMNAVQRMRLKAQQSGKLASTPQMNVVPSTENGEPVIQIMPADPNILYVPAYDPAWIWGPPLWYPYPAWIWPGPGIVVGGLGFGFGLGIDVGFFFGFGWHGWGGWGWRPGWGDHHIFVNYGFIHRYNFNTAHFASVHGSGVWAHDPAHRGGVPYGRPELNQQYRGAVRQNLGARPSAEQTRGALQGSEERFGNREVPRSSTPAGNRGAFAGQQYGRGAQEHSEHGFSSMGGGRSGGFGGGGARGGGGGFGGGGGGRGGGRH